MKNPFYSFEYVEDNEFGMYRRVWNRDLIAGAGFVVMFLVATLGWLLWMAG